MNDLSNADFNSVIQHELVKYFNWIVKVLKIALVDFFSIFYYETFKFYLFLYNVEMTFDNWRLLKNWQLLLSNSTNILYEIAK